MRTTERWRSITLPVGSSSTRPSSSRITAGASAVDSGIASPMASRTHPGASSARAVAAPAITSPTAIAVSAPGANVGLFAALANRQDVVVTLVHRVEVPPERPVLFASETHAAESERPTVDQQSALVGDPDPDLVSAEVSELVIGGRLGIVQLVAVGQLDQQRVLLGPTEMEIHRVLTGRGGEYRLRSMLEHAGLEEQPLARCLRVGRNG